MFNFLELPEWTEADKKVAKRELYDDIFNGNVEWDENLESYRLDMLIDIETVLYSNMPSLEKMAEINDVMDRFITFYCHDEVEHDPNAYCEKYCEIEHD